MPNKSTASVSSAVVTGRSIKRREKCIALRRGGAGLGRLRRYLWNGFYGGAREQPQLTVGYNGFSGGNTLLNNHLGAVRGIGSDGNSSGFDGPSRFRNPDH